MLVDLISRPSSITSQIPPGTPELWPLSCPKLGFPLSKSKSFHPVFIKLSEYVVRHNISTKFYNLPNPPGTPELWPLNCPKTELAVSDGKSSSPKCCHCHWIYHKYDGRILCQFCTLVKTVFRPSIWKNYGHHNLMAWLLVVSDAEVPKMNAPLPVFVQQAAAAKTIGYTSTFLIPTSSICSLVERLKKMAQGQTCTLEFH